LSTTAQTLLQYLPLILIPVSAGVMAHTALLYQHALLLVGVIVLTTLLSLIVCGRLAQALINRHTGDRSGPGA
ncbi:MAG: CidA/LrgA family protein, partial [Oceanococcaceae bacterium]